MLVIAIGNGYRGDDGAGLELAARVRDLTLPNVSVVEALGDVGLIDAWAGHDHVVILDAVRSGAPAGTIKRLDLTGERLPREWFRLSSHELGVADAVELARALHTLPRRLTFVGIEGVSFEAGARLSPEVAGAIDEAVLVVRAETQPLKPAGRHRPAPHSRV